MGARTLTLGVALEEHLSTLGGHAATFEHEDRDLLTPAGANFVAGLAQLSDRVVLVKPGDEEGVMRALLKAGRTPKVITP